MVPTSFAIPRGLLLAFVGPLVPVIAFFCQLAMPMATLGDYAVSSPTVGTAEAAPAFADRFDAAPKGAPQLSDVPMECLLQAPLVDQNPVRVLIAEAGRWYSQTWLIPLRCSLPSAAGPPSLNSQAILQIFRN